MLSLDELVAACDPWLPADVGPREVPRDRAAHPAADGHARRRRHRCRLHVRGRPGDRRGGVEQGDRRPSSRRRCSRGLGRRPTRRATGTQPTLKAVMDDVGGAHTRSSGNAQAAARVAVTGRVRRPAAVRGARSAGPRRVAATARGRTRPIVMTDEYAARTAEDGVSDPGPESARSLTRLVVATVGAGVRGAASLAVVVPLLPGHAVPGVRAGRADRRPIRQRRSSCSGRPSTTGARRRSSPPASTTPSSCGSRASRRWSMVTGGNRPGDRFTEAEASADYLVERGRARDGDHARGRGHARPTSRSMPPPNSCSAPGSTRSCSSPTRTTRCAAG